MCPIRINALPRIPAIPLSKPLRLPRLRQLRFPWPQIRAQAKFTRIGRLAPSVWTPATTAAFDRSEKRAQNLNQATTQPNWQNLHKWKRRWSWYRVRCLFLKRPWRPGLNCLVWNLQCCSAPVVLQPRTVSSSARWGVALQSLHSAKVVWSGVDALPVVSGFKRRHS